MDGDETAPVQRSKTQGPELYIPLMAGEYQYNGVEDNANGCPAGTPALPGELVIIISFPGFVVWEEAVLV
jgi:hypothetical protein